MFYEQSAPRLFTSLLRCLVSTLLDRGWRGTKLFYIRARKFLVGDRVTCAEPSVLAYAHLWGEALTSRAMTALADVVPLEPTKYSAKINSMAA